MAFKKYYVCQICGDVTLDPDGWKQVDVGVFGFVICPSHESVSFADLNPVGPIALKEKKEQK